MVGKRLVVVVIVVLLCSCVTVAAYADHVSQYTDTGGYDESGPGGDIGIKALPPLYRAPGIFPAKYGSTTICPHCGATGFSDVTGEPYIKKLAATVTGYDNSYKCIRCGVVWVAAPYESFKSDTHFHIVDGVLCAYDYAIDYGFYDNGNRRVVFYCSKHKHYSYHNQYSYNPSFEINTFWGVRVIGGEDWEEPVSTPSLWETPFVPPYDSFATLEPVSVDNVGDIVNDTALIVEVVYNGFPYFTVLLTIAIACAFIIVVVRG